MIIKPLKHIEVQELLNNDFSFYNQYLQWIEDKNNDFFVSASQYLYELPRKSLNLNEREKIVQKSLLPNCDKFDFLIPPNIVIINEFNHDEYKFNWVLKKYKNNKIIRRTKEIFRRYGISTKDFFDSAGFICYNTDAKEILSNIFFFPFLMGWMDINILSWNDNSIITINHHLAILTIYKLGRTT